jgi:hypothetical protein
MLFRIEPDGYAASGAKLTIVDARPSKKAMLNHTAV